MRISQAASRRHAQTVCIVTQLPVSLQEKKVTHDQTCVELRTIWLRSATITIYQLGSGKLIIKVEPP